MQIRKDVIVDKIIWGLIVVLLLLFTSLSTYTWGRYVFFLIIGAILFLFASINQWIISSHLDTFQRRFLLFAIYAGISSVWALNGADSIEKMITLISLVVCFFPIYAYYRDFGNIDSLISAIKWGGIFMSLYTIFFYGLSNLMRAGQASNLRIVADYANPNTLGMFAAVVIFIQIWQLLFRKCKKWEIIGILPAILVLGASQSRKAILYVGIALVLLTIFKNLGNNQFFIGVIKIIFGLAVGLFCLYWLSKLEMFAGVAHRFEGLINSITGNGVVDSSTLDREFLRDLGIEWWKKSPIFGIGVGNPHIIAKQYFGSNCYLHNNYVELLCGGGIIGVILFYSMHLYCIKNLLSFKDTNRPYFALMITWIILILIMDYGMVSYYAKQETFYLMCIFLSIEMMKNNMEVGLEGTD